MLRNTGKEVVAHLGAFSVSCGYPLPDIPCYVSTMPQKEFFRSFRWLALAFLLASEARADRAGLDYGVGLLGFLPEEDLGFEAAAGLEAQARYWCGDRAGIAVSLAGSTWQASDTTPFEDGSGQFRGKLTAEGDILLLPISLSGLLRTDELGRIRLLFETGLRLMVLDSSVNVKIREVQFFKQAISFEEEIDFDDTLCWFAGATLEARITPTTRLYTGIGYQQGLEKTGVSLLGISLGDYDIMDALVVRAGLAFTL